ncbi:MAG: hypothetical protein RL653_2959 [Pseudomonadota bacterium]|jgi:pimeloyl-ACP methyl ester carboxylesterase
MSEASNGDSTVLTRAGPGGTSFSAPLHGRSGPLVVCLHGFPDLPGTFAPLIEPLRAAGYRVLVPTLRGYERSSVHASGSYHVRSLAEDILGWLDHLGEPSASLVGHDWGAVAGWGAVASAPHRFRAFVSLAIPHAGAFLRRLPLHPRQWLNSGYILFFQLPLLPGWALSDRRGQLVRRLWRDWSPGWEPPERHVNEVVARLSDPVIGEAALGYHRCLARLWEAPNRELLPLLMPPPRVPVLALSGERDGCIRPEFFRACMASVDAPAGPEHRVVRGAGHFMHLEAPAAVLEQVLPFLRRWSG